MNNALLEIEVTHDVFVSGVGNVEIMDGNARITFYVDHEAVGGGTPDKIVVAKLIVPIASIPECIREVVQATWSRLTHVPILEMVVADRVGRH